MQYPIKKPIIDYKLNNLTAYQIYLPNPAVNLATQIPWPQGLIAKMIWRWGEGQIQKSLYSICTLPIL